MFEVLIFVIWLVGLSGVFVDYLVCEVVYFYVVFEEYVIIFVEGCLMESFLFGLGLKI